LSHHVGKISISGFPLFCAEAEDASQAIVTRAKMRKKARSMVNPRALLYVLAAGLFEEGEGIVLVNRGSRA
jgi:hypothetical protein